MDGATDERLLAALGHDRGEALAILVRRHTPALYPTARRLADDPWAAEDLLQETWLRLLRSPPRLSPGQTALPWLRRVLVHLAVDQARRRTRRRTAPEGLDPAFARADPAPSPEAMAERADERRCVRAALARLPPADRAILVLLHGEGWSVREVALALSLPVTIVKNRALRGRRRLRALIEKGGRGEVEGDGGTRLRALGHEACGRG